MPTTRQSSESRPMTGSSLPENAISLRLRVYSRRSFESGRYEIFFVRAGSEIVGKASEGPSASSIDPPGAPPFAALRRSPISARQSAPMAQRMRTPAFSPSRSSPRSMCSGPIYPCPSISDSWAANFRMSFEWGVSPRGSPPGSPSPIRSRICAQTPAALIPAFFKTDDARLSPSRRSPRRRCSLPIKL